MWSHHEETRELRGERDNARNNARCTQARKTTHGLDGQHQDVDRTPRGRVSQNDGGYTNQYQDSWISVRRHRSVFLSCQRQLCKALTVESYTVIYAANIHIYYYQFSITHSLIPDLKPSFSANPSHCSLSFYLFKTYYMITQTFTVTSEHIRFYFLVFLFYTFQLSFPCGRLS